MNGRLGPGDRLPSERAFAERLQVSRTSVREAFRVLEVLGVVEIKRGADGVRLRNEMDETFVHQVMRLQLALRYYDPRAVYEFRALLESWAVRRVASSPNGEICAQLDVVLARMRAADIKAAAMHELDIQFHELIINASGNILVGQALRSCRSVIATSMQAAISERDWNRTRKALDRDHAAIRDAIISNSPELAATLMQKHIERWGKRALAAGVERWPRPRRG